MSAQEEDLQELLNAEEHLEKLLANYEKLTASESAKPTGGESRIDPDQVIEEYASTCDLVRRNITNLGQRIAVQVHILNFGSS